VLAWDKSDTGGKDRDRTSAYFGEPQNRPKVRDTPKTNEEGGTVPFYRTYRYVHNRFSLHSSHFRSSSDLTKVLAASKENMPPPFAVTWCHSYPSQSDMETHPASLYTLFGQLGMLEGRLLRLLRLL
jgi:hypothetical protein